MQIFRFEIAPDMQEIAGDLLRFTMLVQAHAANIHIVECADRLGERLRVCTKRVCGHECERSDVFERLSALALTGPA